MATMTEIEETRPKRTRVGTACHECRRKKVRCDGATPQCGNCKLKNIKCELPNKFIRANASQDYVKFLETRLGLLESQAAHRTGSCSPYTGEMHAEVTPKQQPTLEQVSEPGPGSSSVLSFMNLVEAAAGKPKLETSPKPIDVNPFARKRNIHPQSHALPPRDVGDALVATFMEQIHPLYPIVYKPTFCEEFNSMWMGESSDITYASMNVVFALGAAMSDRKDHEVYFSRARVYLDSTIMRWTFSSTEGPTIEMLQTILLTSLYLLLTQKVAPCRNLLALLSRLAQETRRSFDHNEIQREYFSRLWYGALSIDRLVSIIFGKPFVVISDTAIKKPTPADDEYIAAFAGEGQSPTLQQPAVAAFFVHNIEISEITTDVLRMLYNNEGTGATTLGVSRKNTLRTILDIENRMVSFENQIPEHLQISRISQHEIGSVFYTQTFIMHTRILHLKILLYRPVLLPSDDSLKTESPIYTSLNATISRMCIESALDLINFVWEGGETCKISKSWYTMFYVYNAAVVVLAALLKSHSKVIEVDILLLDNAWSRALALIPTYEAHIDTANQCLHTLLDAHDRMLSPDKLLDFFFESLI